MAKTSVLVPVYGVEKYIERCANSLFAQSFNDLEYILRIMIPTLAAVIYHETNSKMNLIKSGLNSALVNGSLPTVSKV